MITNFCGNRLNKKTLYLHTPNNTGFANFRGMTFRASQWFDTLSAYASMKHFPFDRIVFGKMSQIRFDNMGQLQDCPELHFVEDAPTFTGISFEECASLKSVSWGNLKTTALLSGFSSRCFYNCTSLESVTDLMFTSDHYSSGFYQMFYNCTSLKNLTFKKGTQLNGDLDLMYSTQLTGQSIANIAYYMIGSHTLTISDQIDPTTIYVKANDTNDGLTVCEATDPNVISDLSTYVTSKGWTLVLSNPNN